MCKKLIVFCLVLLVIAATSASAKIPNNAPFLAVDISGGGGPVQTFDPPKYKTAPWATWQNWSFANPPADTAGPWTQAFGSITVTITKQTANGSGLASRNRGGGQSDDQYLGYVHRDFIYVAHSTVAGWGRDYFKVDFSGLPGSPNKKYEITVWNYDENYEKTGTKYMAWGIESPGNYPEYQPVVGGGGGAAKLARVPMGGDWPANPLVSNPFYYAGTFSVYTNGSGVATIYGWADSDTWTGSQHAPVNGFAIGVPEPATIALLGLGGLALLRRKRA